MSEFIFRASGRVHPHKDGMKFNEKVWGWRNTKTGNVFNTQELADADLPIEEEQKEAVEVVSEKVNKTKRVSRKRASRKKASTK